MDSRWQAQRRHRIGSTIEHTKPERVALFVAHGCDPFRVKENDGGVASRGRRCALPTATVDDPFGVESVNVKSGRYVAG